MNELWPLLPKQYWLGFPAGPQNVTVLASANADDSGFYVIAGSALVGCADTHLYGLRLYAPKLAHFPVQIVNETIDILNVPQENVFGDDQPVKVFEKDINGSLIMPS
ncbi:hypothetical protein AAVH_25108 [Aphelenchoides avenae]|nr:hypothetical protein AAVH_25108 [Aphelenchus avenae]